MSAAGSTNFIIHLIAVILVVSDLQMTERLVPTLLAVCTPLHRQSARWSLDRQGAGLWGGETQTSLRILLGG
jgi:dihydroxyacid dehydratase/phosphogluconate dehydratase